jgi:hypothetical protein
MPFKCVWRDAGLRPKGRPHIRPHGIPVPRITRADALPRETALRAKSPALRACDSGVLVIDAPLASADQDGTAPFGAAVAGQAAMRLEVKARALRNPGTGALKPNGFVSISRMADTYITNFDANQ